MLHVANPSRGLNLREILPSTQFFGSDEIFVRSVCSDSRQCREGSSALCVQHHSQRVRQLRG